jgi:hypothetical protein
LDYADSLFDVRQRLVTSFTYEIPNFSHVRGLGWLPDRFASGWRITGIDTLQTGLPVLIKDYGFTSLPCDAVSAWLLGFAGKRWPQSDVRRQLYFHQQQLASTGALKNCFFVPFRGGNLGRSKTRN